MQEYYYDITNSNNITKEKHKNESLISKFYNSVKKIGQKIQNLIELKVESNNENKNLNEPNIKQINFNEFPISLNESFTEHNYSLNKEINSFPKKMNREEFKKNPFIENNYSRINEVDNNFKEEETNNNLYLNSNFFPYSNNLKKEMMNFQTEKKNNVHNSFELNKKRQRENIIDNNNNDLVEENNSPLKSENRIISNINTFQIEGNTLNNINESNISISSIKNNNNNSLMSITLRSLDEIKNDIDKKRLESIKEIEKFRGKYYVSYDIQKDYQTRKEIIENYYKKKLDKLEEITQKSEKEKKKRLDSFKLLKELKEGSFNIKAEKKPKNTLSTIKSGEISFMRINKNNNKNTNNNDNKNNKDVNISLFNSFGTNNSFNNGKKEDYQSTVLKNNEKEENKLNLFSNKQTSLLLNDKKEENSLFENKKNENLKIQSNLNEKEINSSNKEKSIFSSNKENNKQTGSLFSNQMNGNFFSGNINNNNDQKENNSNQSSNSQNFKFGLLQSPTNLNSQPNNSFNNNSEKSLLKENQKNNSIFSTNQTSIFNNNNNFNINNKNDNENKQIPLFGNQTIPSQTTNKDSNSLFGAKTVTLKDTNPISNVSENIEHKTSIFKSNINSQNYNNLPSPNQNNSGSLVNKNNPFLNTPTVPIANVFTSPEKINKNDFPNQNNINLFGYSNH